jgi:hypothetical protein
MRYRGININPKVYVFCHTAKVFVFETQLYPILKRGGGNKYEFPYVMRFCD